MRPPLVVRASASDQDTPVTSDSRPEDLSPANLRRAEELAEKYLDIWEEADRQGDPLAQVDDALATLAREYHDLKKQFADTPSSPEDTPSSSDGGLEEKDQLQPP